MCLYLNPYNCVTVDPCSTVSLKRQIIKVVATAEDITSPDRSLQQEVRREVEERSFLLAAQSAVKVPGYRRIIGRKEANGRHSRRDASQGVVETKAVVES